MMIMKLFKKYLITLNNLETSLKFYKTFYENNLKKIIYNRLKNFI